MILPLFGLIFFLFTAVGTVAIMECKEHQYTASLQDTCGPQMNVIAPDSFHISFRSNYGDFVAHCDRQRAPVWVDRIYNLVLNGYYNDNYFFRVIDDFIVQFGTNGDPSVSNIYNFNSPYLGECGVLEPQPPYMPINEGVHGLSNVFGTLAMSTSYNETTETTWNATAELFINLNNNRCHFIRKWLYQSVNLLFPDDVLCFVAAIWMKCFLSLCASSIPPTWRARF
jgi:cyclophilin family peptidyl-prolyl cis-trans isomerase